MKKLLVLIIISMSLKNNSMLGAATVAGSTVTVAQTGYAAYQAYCNKRMAQISEIKKSLASSLSEPNLIDILTDFNKPVSLEQWKENNQSLVYASVNGDIKVVEELLESEDVDVNVDSIIKHPMPPLLLALSRGHNSIAKLLLAHGADINARNSFCQTALHVAATTGFPETVKLVLELGLDINCKDIRCQTPLMIAINYGNKAVVDFLVSQNAKLDNVDDNGLTALMHAVCARDEYMVKLLIDNGANKDIEDRYNRTALDHANDVENRNIINLLTPNSTCSIL